MTTKINGTGRSGEHITGDIEYFTAYTLVDITDSGITDPRSADVTGYNQAQNLNVLLQLVSLRAQPIIVSISRRENQDLADYSFGSNFVNASATLWIVKFATEYKGAWANASDQTYHLINDCHSVAITAGLEETETFSPVVFDTTSATVKNLYFVRNDNL